MIAATNDLYEFENLCAPPFRVGNIQSVSYSGGGLSYTQSFTYDALNRLATAQENAGASWSQTNGYDRYANRWIALPGGAQSIYCNTSNNRITGWSYDASGNLLNDGVTNYTYDAEGHIKTVNGTTAYTYDGGGQRVRKLVGENIRFVYGIGGELIAEFDGSTGALKKEYVYGGGTVATIEPTAVNANGTRYATADHLGSPRVATNSGGAVVSRHDYLPFGEELFAGTGGRTVGMGFSVADGNRKKFTGYEHDNETGLDFAQARYHSSNLGRFTSPDPFGGSMLAGDPQTFNRYAYVGNNPVNATDPTGLAAEGGGGFLPGANGALGRVKPGEGSISGTDGSSGQHWAMAGGGSASSEPEAAPIEVTDGELFAGLEEILAAGPQDTRTICDRMADDAQRIADEVTKPGFAFRGDFDEAFYNFNKQFGLFTFGSYFTSNPWGFSGTWASGRNNVLGEGRSYQGDSGFHPDFKDTLQPGEDAVHHFGGYFSAGLTGWKAASDQHRADDREHGNWGDVRLGDQAYRLGAYVRSDNGTFEHPKLKRIGELIRSTICRGGPVPK